MSRVTDDEFYEAFDPNNIEVNNSFIDHPEYGGALIEVNGSFATYDIEDGLVQRLPSFIKSKEDAVSFFETLKRHYQEGQKDGERRFKRSLFETMGFDEILKEILSERDRMLS